jgi:predicted NBD/HSP70 family sugar kinase
VILEAVRAAETISRVEIVHATGLTGATVSTVVRRLLDEGLVTEVGTAESTGGKPRTMLRLDASARFAVGAHLDHGGVTYVVTNLGGDIVARMRRRGLGNSGPSAVVARMAGEIATMLATAGVPRDRVLGVGICAPGPVAPAPATTLAPPGLREWVDFPLRQSLEQALGMPALIDNDATAGALGEHWARGVPGAVCLAALYMGTGIGGGVVLGGWPYRGASGNAIEVGHICVDLAGPDCWCGNRGCVEVMGGPSTVVARAREAGVLTDDSVSLLSDFAALTRLAVRGEENALALLEDSARYVAVAAHTLATLMDADHVVLTGPSFGAAGSIYLPVIRAELDARFLARASHTVGVSISQHAYEAAAIGAAALVLQSELVPHQAGGVSPVGSVGTGGAMGTVGSMGAVGSTVGSKGTVPAAAAR